MDLVKAIKRIHPEIDFVRDVIVLDDGTGQRIHAWNLTGVPQPTKKELTAAWNKIKDLPEPAPPVSPADQLAQLQEDNMNTMLAVAESYEMAITQDEQRGQETLDAMLAVAEVYETMLAMQARIDDLEARLAEPAEGGV